MKHFVSAGQFQPKCLKACCLGTTLSPLMEASSNGCKVLKSTADFGKKCVELAWITMPNWHNRAILTGGTDRIVDLICVQKAQISRYDPNKSVARGHMTYSNSFNRVIWLNIKLNCAFPYRPFSAVYRILNRVRLPRV